MLSTDQESVAPRRTPADPRREVLERVLGSPWFAKSGRLSGLLVFLCEWALDGRADAISEQSIGQQVFGRAENYDSANDGIVRTQISRLRGKLDAYFEAEGAAETVRIVIPRGGYVPYFVPHEPARSPAPLAAASPAMPEVPLPAVAPLPPPEKRRRLPAGWLPWALAGLLAVLLAGALLLLAQKNEVPRHPLWNSMFVHDRPTLLVPADSTMVFWQNLLHKNIALPEYLGGQFRNASPPNEPEGEIFGRGRYTSIVDLEATSQLAALAVRQHSSAQVRYARDVRPNDLKENNLILIGTSEANPWVSLFEKDMNFVFRMDRGRHVFSVINTAPHSGEPAQWDSHFSTDPQSQVYCVVAYRPNLSGSGKALILEGTSMAGTECAWDFVADDSQLLPFLQGITRPDGTVPYFEVVLGTRNMSGSAVRSNILAWRVQGGR